jgi:hypothetical protein
MSAYTVYGMIVKVTVKESHYKPGQAFGAKGG